MIDKAGIKIHPKQAISIQIGDTLPDILPLLQRGLLDEFIKDAITVKSDSVFFYAKEVIPMRVFGILV